MPVLTKSSLPPDIAVGIRPGGETPPLPAKEFFVRDRVRGGFAWFFVGAGLKPAPTRHHKGAEGDSL